MARATTNNEMNLRTKSLIIFAVTMFGLKSKQLVGADCVRDFTLENGHVNWTNNDTSFNSSVHVYCDTGYQLIGDDEIICQEDSSWSYNVSCLITDCGDHYSVRNGFINWTERQTTFNNTVPVLCDSGYNILGPDEITCQENGLWSNNTNCKIIHTPGSTNIIITVAVVSGGTFAILALTSAVILLYLKRSNKLCFAEKPEMPHFGELEMEFKVWTKFRPAPVKKEEFAAYVDVLHAENNKMFSDGFRLLCEQSPSYPTAVAETPACLPKSRYTNILPFDHSRVKLRPIEEVEGSDFINANYIPGYSKPREYIATQCPLLETRTDFWRMIWEHNVDIIVMLSKRSETITNSLPKNQSVERFSSGELCDPYWPDKVENPCYYGDVKLKTLSESVLSGHITRVMEATVGNERRVITQIHFPRWPDHGCPTMIMPFINFVTMVRQYKPQQLLVHCSTGVSRTGTFIAIDRLLQHVKKHDDVNIFSVILDMRKFRRQMVKTEEEFVFVYECIKRYIALEEGVDEGRSKGSKPRKENCVYSNNGFEEEEYV